MIGCVDRVFDYSYALCKLSILIYIYLIFSVFTYTAGAITPVNPESGCRGLTINQDRDNDRSFTLPDETAIAVMGVSITDRRYSHDPRFIAQYVNITEFASIFLVNRQRLIQAGFFKKLAVVIQDPSLLLEFKPGIYEAGLARDPDYMEDFTPESYALWLNRQLQLGSLLDKLGFVWSPVVTEVIAKRLADYPVLDFPSPTEADMKKRADDFIKNLSDREISQFIFNLNKVYARDGTPLYEIPRLNRKKIQSLLSDPASRSTMLRPLLKYLSELWILFHNQQVMSRDAEDLSLQIIFDGIDALVANVDIHQNSRPFLVNFLRKIVVNLEPGNEYSALVIRNDLVGMTRELIRAFRQTYPPEDRPALANANRTNASLVGASTDVVNSSSVSSASTVSPDSTGASPAFVPETVPPVSKKRRGSDGLNKRQRKRQHRRRGKNGSPSSIGPSGGGTSDGTSESNFTLAPLSNQVESDLNALDPQIREIVIGGHIPSIEADPFDNGRRVGNNFPKDVFSYPFSGVGGQYRILYGKKRRNIVIIGIGSRANFYENMIQRVRRGF